MRGLTERKDTSAAGVKADSIEGIQTARACNDLHHLYRGSRRGWKTKTSPGQGPKDVGLLTPRSTPIS
jgi:hypothetical protein